MLILGFLLSCCPDVIQSNLRKSVEANTSLLEKDKIMIQHRATEHQRKAEQEAENEEIWRMRVRIQFLLQYRGILESRLWNSPEYVCLEQVARLY